MLLLMLAPIMLFHYADDVAHSTSPHHLLHFRICDDRLERGGAELASLLKLIPLDRLMIETDAPYLTPRTIKCVRGHGQGQGVGLVYLAYGLISLWMRI